MSDKYDSVNKRNQEISESMILYILGVWQNSHWLMWYWWAQNKMQKS